VSILLPLLLAYGLGSLSGSLLLGRLRGVDIRTRGSGNAGGTNALRTFGLRFALAVVIIDVGKGALAAGWAPGILGEPPAWLPYACGLAGVVGHCYPVWFGFRGGKGAATAVGALAVLSPWLLLPMGLTWCVVLALTGYVGVATVLAGLSLVPASLWLEGPSPLALFCLVLAGFMAYTHRENFRRLAAGTEHRFEKARIAHWLSGRGRRDPH
jgi:glycerol-3-phosphate acyltransferase PlsY